MNNLFRKSTDENLKAIFSVKNYLLNSKGEWIKTLGTALGMTTSNLSNIMGTSQNNVSKQELNEKYGNIKISTLQNYADKLGLEFVYGFTFKDKTLEDIIDKRAFEMAEDIINKSIRSMNLEGEDINEEYIRKQIKEKAIDLKYKRKKYMEIIYDYGQTPLSEEEKNGLKLKISDKSTLNNMETLNISQAIQKYNKKNISINTLLDVKFIKDLHKDMFGNVWSWSGKFRNTNKNIGCEYFRIEIEIRNFLEDISYIFNTGSYDSKELLAFIAYRLVFIHPFPNGNGRFSRFYTELFAKGLGVNEISWGKHKDTDLNNIRKMYINALREIDYNNDYQYLIDFMFE